MTDYHSDKRYADWLKVYDEEVRDKVRHFAAGVWQAVKSVQRYDLADPEDSK